MIAYPVVSRISVTPQSFAAVTESAMLWPAVTYNREQLRCGPWCPDSCSSLESSTNKRASQELSKVQEPKRQHANPHKTWQWQLPDKSAERAQHTVQNRWRSVQDINKSHLRVFQEAVRYLRRCQCSLRSLDGFRIAFSRVSCWRIRPRSARDSSAKVSVVAGHLSMTARC